MAFKPYPLMFIPILKEKVWGGTNLKKYVKISSDKTGEAWLISDRDDSNSIVANGVYRGMGIREIMKKYSGIILGKKLQAKYGDRYPLLFKFLDTTDRISVQVHPDDAYARRKGFDSGKTEMWYVLDKKSGAFILAGVKKGVDKMQLQNAAMNGGLEKKLKMFRSKKGDTFFIPAGTVHAIGRGNVIYEIQQNSDITYRLYDWGRDSLNGNRQLDIKDAIASLKLDSKGGKIVPESLYAGNGSKIAVIANSGCFRVCELKVDKDINYWYNKKMPLTIAVIEGEIDIVLKEGGNCNVKKGGIVLIPCELTGFLVKIKRRTGMIITEVK